MAATNAGAVEVVEQPLRSVQYIAALCSVHDTTVKKWVAERKIPHLRLNEGKRPIIRFDEDEVRAWLDERRVAPVRFDTPASERS